MKKAYEITVSYFVMAESRHEAAAIAEAHRVVPPFVTLSAWDTSRPASLVRDIELLGPTAQAIVAGKVS